MAKVPKAYRKDFSPNKLYCIKFMKYDAPFNIFLVDQQC